MSDADLRRGRLMRGAAMVCLVFAFTVSSVRIVHAQNGQIRVDSALPNLAAHAVTIGGVNFGTQTPTVTLNDMPLTVLVSSPTQIVAVLPGSVIASPGTYQLVVRKGGANSQNSANVATIDVAIYDEPAAPAGTASTLGLQGPAGPTGPPGPQGATGPAGPQGAAGPAGPQGATGSAGPQGAIGPAGPRGDAGPAGPEGAAGPAGPQGPAGPAGAAGPQGATGAPGAQGATGATGPQGPAGPTGQAGLPGATGATGPMGLQGPEGPRIGRVYRWNVFDTFSNPTGTWLFNDSATAFGGVSPSTWSDGSALAASVSPDKDVQRSLLTQKGYPGRNAMVVADTRLQYSSTDGKLVVILFRVKNTTAAPITWTPHFWYSCYRPWGEMASVALNGVNAYTDAVCESSGKLGLVALSLPANRTSTVVFVSGSGIPASYSVNSHWVRATVAGFIDDSLTLPAGLEFVDDLDTATGGYEQ